MFYASIENPLSAIDRLLSVRSNAHKICVGLTNLTAPTWVLYGNK